MFQLLIPLSLTPTTTDVFILSIVLPFPDCHVVRIAQFVVFSEGLLLLSNMRLSFLHEFSWLDNAFLLTLIIFHCLHLPQFIYLATYWRISWLLPNFDSYKYNCCKYPCTGFWVDISFKLLGKYQVVWWLNLMVRTHLVCKKLSNSLPQWL